MILPFGFEQVDTQEKKIMTKSQLQITNLIFEIGYW